MRRAWKTSNQTRRGRSFKFFSARDVGTSSLRRSPRAVTANGGAGIGQVSDLRGRSSDGGAKSKRMTRIDWIVSGPWGACRAKIGNRAAEIRVNARRFFVLRVYDGGTEYPYRRYESLACAKRAGSEFLRRKHG